MRYYMTNKHLRRCQLVFCSCSFVCSSNVRVNEKLKSHFAVARKTVATECFENLTAKQTRLKSIHQKNPRLWFAFYLNSIKWVYDYNKLGCLWLPIKSSYLSCPLFVSHCLAPVVRLTSTFVSFQVTVTLLERRISLVIGLFLTSTFVSFTIN